MKVGVSLPVREMKDDLGAITEFAVAADEMGLTHLRIPDQVIRPGNQYVHESISLLAYLAGLTKQIELVPSVLVLPLRQTALVARQSASLDVLSGGRLRLGIGIGINPEEYRAMGVDFNRRGAICDEQLQVLHALWSQAEVTFKGEFHDIQGNGINPRPLRDKIPVWIGGRSVPGDRVVSRIGRWADGWFVLASPEDYPSVRARIDAAAVAAGREPSDIGTEAGVAVVGPREHEWQARVKNWHETGLTHLCLRTLGGDLQVHEHLPKLRQAMDQLPI